MAEMDRRGFLSVTALTALGVAAESALAPEGAFALARDLADLAPGWKPLSALTTVSVASNAAVRGYPKLAPGSAFDDHPSVKLLESSLAGLSGTTALAAIQAQVAVGGTVLIKPNWVEPGKWATGKITHPSLVLAVARLAAEAVGPTGSVVIAEGTSEGKDLPKILSATTFMGALASFGLDSATATRAKVTVRDLNSSSAGSVKVKLGKHSRFAGTSSTLWDASGQSVGKYGNGRVGTYKIATPLLTADLVIDFAKAKVHCSAGVTLALKNYVGIVPTTSDATGKWRLKYVPHSSSADKAAGRTYVLNQTIGRTSADLHAAALYAKADGTLAGSPQRKLLCIVDGAVSGSNTQFAPTPRRTGWVAASYDPVALDHVATRCMGFDPVKVVSLAPSRKGVLKLGVSSPSSIRIAFADTSGKAFTGYFTTKRALKAESVVAKWGGAIELEKFAIKAPKITVAGGRVTVKPASGTGAVAVRLQADGEYLTVPRAANGTYSAAMPTGITGPLRVVLTDAHFNMWSGKVTG